MPFKKTHQSNSLPSGPLFIGRANELLFFVQQILKPAEPVHNLLSIWGQGGVGKTTLLRQFKNQATMADFRDFCLTAWVDERQETPASIMEHFAQQLPLSNKFEKALRRYRETLQMSPLFKISEPLHQRMISRTPDFAGSLVEGVPFVGPSLRELAKAGTEHLLDRYALVKEKSNVATSNSPLDSLTRIFFTELNQLATGKSTLFSSRTKRERKILLFFDTFEQVAEEVVPWLFYAILDLDIHSNIVFILAGRYPLERSTAASPKLWLPYYENHTLHALSLSPFTQEETSAYLAERGITSKKEIATIWHLSHGLPLYLGLLTTNARGTFDPTKDIVDNFLHRLPASEQLKRQLVLDAALFSRPFALDDLETLPYLAEQERPSLYGWLISQPFIRPSSLHGRFVYHNIAQELFQRHLYQTSPKAYYTTRRILATYYHQQFEYLSTVQEKSRYSPSGERLEVMLAIAEQRFFLPDEESHLQALSPLLDIWDYDSVEHLQMLIRRLRKIVQSLSYSQTDAHAYRVAQVFLRYIEMLPTQYDQAHKQAWLVVRDELLELMKQASSPELLVAIYDANARGHLRLGEYQQALMWCEHALALHPHSVRIKRELGVLHYLLKEYQQALDCLNDGLKLAPYHPHLYIWRGRTYGKLKAYEQALADFNRGIKLDTSDYEALGYYYNDRGRIHLRLKEYHKARADWDQALEVAPPELPLAGRIHFQRGCAYLWLGDILQAITCFTHSSEIGSIQVFSSPRAQDAVLWIRAWSILCQTAPDLSILAYLEPIAVQDHYTGYVCRGVIALLQKKFPQALEALQHATTLCYRIGWYPDVWDDFWREWDAPFWLAMTYLALDQGEEAHKTIEQALALEMPPILLKPLVWFEQEKPKLYEQFVQPLLGTYEI